MAVPKQKQSKGRTRRRRSGKGFSAPKFCKCPHCGKNKLPHQVCPYCGFYKDNEVVDVLKKIKNTKNRRVKK